MMMLKRVALPIVCMTLLAACGGGGGGSANNTGGNTGATGSAGNTGGTNNTGGSGTAVGAGGNAAGDTGSAGGNTAGSGGSAGTDPSSEGNTDPGDAGTDGGAPDGGSSGDAGSGSPSEPVRTGPARAAEGVYAGALTGGSYHFFETLILEDGQYWSLYGENQNSYFTVHGFVQGSGSSENEVFTASDLRDFGLTPAEAGTMTASYDANAHTIEGTSTFDGTGAVQLSGGAIPDSPYDYDTVASIIDLGDHWNGTSAAGMSISITFSPDGSFTMTDGSCWSTGTMKPRASGKNVFDVSVTFTGSCTMANETATGVAVAYPLTSTGQMQLIAAVVSPSRTQGMAFFANR